VHKIAYTLKTISDRNIYPDDIYRMLFYDAVSYPLFILDLRP
jgi:hypothetical protein